ncbi:MAG: sterol desaturase family protein [Bacteroidota bacterium]|nr:sterol desaturase family protein [Bacteroidota bacterium]
MLQAVVWQDVLVKFFTTYGMVSLRYLLFAGSLFLVFYVWKKRDFFRFKIQQKFPENKHVAREIGYSFLSLSVFAVVATFVFILRKHGYTKIYTNFSDHSMGYFIFSVIAFILIHDTYFYWSHRLMHWKKIYPYVHKVHHRSTNPTPWAAFAFHPIEAVMEVGILPLMVFLMPIHHYAILCWVLYQTGMNVIGHLGFELYPSGFVDGKFTKWHNTSTHHNIHHKLVNCNYGLYYNFWDRIMSTNHARYQDEFENVKARSRAAEQVVKPVMAESFAD